MNNDICNLTMTVFLSLRHHLVITSAKSLICLSPWTINSLQLVATPTVVPAHAHSFLSRLPKAHGHGHSDITGQYSEIQQVIYLIEDLSFIYRHTNMSTIL